MTDPDTLRRKAGDRGLPAAPVAIRSFAAWIADGGDGPQTASLGDGTRRARRGALHLAWVARGTSEGPPRDDWHFLLGDDSEWTGESPDANLASGVPIRYDEDAAALVIPTSIVALPPVFVYRARGLQALASDLDLLSRVPGVRLELDPQGVVELGWFGHPVGHRTLFRHVELVPAASRLTFGAANGARVDASWSLPDLPALDWPGFIEQQIAVFTRQVDRLDVSRTFLSLTAGLDTRTVFASLAATGKLVPAATMTGRRRSLDARTAARLCRAYGIRHHAVTFDDQFTRELPRYVERAARYSGGLASVDQAPEIFMYEQLGAGFTARLSGNLGNQVGRGGTEGVSIRGADLSLLAAPLRGAGPPAGHWLLGHLGRDDEAASLRFIFSREIPFTLMSNFTLGNHFAAQQSPYASRALIETLATRPRDGVAAPSGAKLAMRLRDLRHRFLGEPAAHSFQRTLVTRLNGFAATCPVNWGWRPSGGMSIPGALLGAATLLGMAARATGLDGGALRVPVQWTGLPALHDFRESRQWLRVELRDFTYDTLRASSVRDAGLFDARALDAILDRHYAGTQDHYHTVTFALDVALAHRTFCQ